ncbi:MAG: hypothetical protein QF486_00415 [Candidatus Woesearchaeota archaeon]|jgi:hypothetical protein|nr:hypothetical protein [Candidatus Woesearchaeota archaeon]MDP7181314.1 hypothetical protein [Candidatus Woesearchaeota archaeon]MDP7198067.1 hypothetical protein [Candidatus Woesearchaeota archaeon]MDP7466901.1 hypothetical protein [Candidatus Woesearchaeota archaeon]MDP7647336.1 hypothetical protein [Candidatus Woesearchaeota archaeon]|tara:strand:- start:521 stop:799 length:279 start_codon:yes stop_codon:yes gene_type:complete
MTVDIPALKRIPSLSDENVYLVYGNNPDGSFRVAVYVERSQFQIVPDLHVEEGDLEKLADDKFAEMLEEIGSEYHIVPIVFRLHYAKHLVLR